MSEIIPTYQQLAARWKALRSTRDLPVREVACVGAPRTLLCVDIGDSSKPSIHLSAGVHGDEPAGVLALLELAEGTVLDDRFAYRIWPCTNPTGFDARTRESIDEIDVNRTFGRGGSSPEAKAIVMANRDRKFIVSLDLHEDDEAVEFYCYEYGNGDIGASLAPVCLRPDPDAEAEAIGGLSLSLLLRRGAAQDVLTLESPAALPLEERVAMHRDAVRKVIRQLSQASQGFVK